jgi:hypothetical protein
MSTNETGPKQEEESVYVSYRDFYRQLENPEIARDFLCQLIDEEYVIDSVPSKADVELLSHPQAVKLGREYFNLYYLIQCTPENQNRN